MASDPRAALEAYAEPPHEWHVVPGRGVQPTPRRDRYAPLAFDALRAVLRECDLLDGLVTGEADQEHPVAAAMRRAITNALEGKAEPETATEERETTYLILREDFGMWLVTASSPAGAVEQFRRDRPGDRHRGVFEERLHAEEGKA